MDNFYVLTVATEYNKYVKEWEKSVKNLGYNYKILGIGEKWEGFNTLITLILNELKKYKENDIIVIVDSYDLLLLEEPSKLLTKYKNKSNKKILIGSEGHCVINCYKEIVEKCNLHSKNNENYPNTGLVIGPKKLLIDAYEYCLKHGNNDDQIGLSKYASENCDNVVLDYENDIILNYYVQNIMSPHLININLPNVIIKNNRIYNETDNNYPSIIHMPYQSADFGKRSEFIRNFVFPEREKITFYEYFGDFTNHIYKALKYPVYKEYVMKIVFCILLFLIFSYFTFKMNQFFLIDIF